MKNKIFAVITISLLCFSMFVMLQPRAKADEVSLDQWTWVNVDGFGNPTVTYATVLKEFSGFLYAGTATNIPDGEGRGEVWRTADGMSWQQTVAAGFGERNEQIQSMCAFNGYLYAGTHNIDGCQIWRSTNGDTSSWQKVVSDGFSSDSGILAVNVLIVFDGYLYAGTGGSVGHGMTLWRTSDGLIWDPITTDGFGDSNNIRLTSASIFGDYLYVGTSNEAQGGEVWRSVTGDSGSWELTSHGGFGDAQNIWFYEATAFQDRLYMAVARGPSSAGAIWRTPDGLSWEKATVDGFGDSDNNEIRHLIVFDEKLYAGTRNGWVHGCEMWKSTDGMTWQKSGENGFGHSNNRYVTSTEVFCDVLYVGTWNQAEGCEVWAIKRAPSSPTNLIASPQLSAVELDWNDPSEGSPITAFNIYRGSSSGAEQFLASVEGDTHIYLDATASKSLQYYYVTATNAIGEGPPSNEVKCSSEKSFLGVETVVDLESFTTKRSLSNLLGLFTVQQNFEIAVGGSLVHRFWAQNVIVVWPNPLSASYSLMWAAFEIRESNDQGVTWRTIVAQSQTTSRPYRIHDPLILSSTIEGDKLVMKNDCKEYSYSLPIDSYILGLRSYRQPEVVLVGPPSIPHLPPGTVVFKDPTEGHVDTYARIGSDAGNWLQCQNFVALVPHTGEISKNLRWNTSGDFSYEERATDQGLFFWPNYESPIVSPP